MFSIITPWFERSTCFYVTISKNFEHFQYSNFENKNENRKLGYRFLVEGTSTENATFPYETPLLEANVKTNRMDFSQ